LAQEVNKFDVIVNPSWKMYVKEWAEEYQNILMTCVSETKEHKEKLIIIIEALEHFIHMD